MITTKESKTYADYAALEEGAPYQLIDGDLIMSPSPSRIHQQILLKLALRIQQFAKKHQRGEVYVAPFDVKLSEIEVYQPDAIFVATERKYILTEQNVDGAPDLVVEVLFPATGYYDLTHKRHIYETSGVREYWIVDPIEQTVLVLALEDEKYTTISEARETGRVASRVLEGFRVDLEQLFSF